MNMLLFLLVQPVWPTNDAKRSSDRKYFTVKAQTLHLKNIIFISMLRKVSDDISCVRMMHKQLYPYTWSMYSTIYEYIQSIYTASFFHSVILEFKVTVISYSHWWTYSWPQVNICHTLQPSSPASLHSDLFYEATFHVFSFPSGWFDLRQDFYFESSALRCVQVNSAATHSVFQEVLTSWRSSDWGARLISTQPAR